MEDWRQRDSEYENECKKYPHPVPSRDFILATLKEQGRAMSFSALAKLYGLNRGEKETLKHRLKAMLRDEQLDEQANGKVTVAEPRETLTGKVFAHPEGFGFFIPDDKTLTDGDDFFLSFREMQNVMHGDKIQAREKKGGRKGKREGKVVRVLEHANHHILGRLVDDYGIQVVKAENRRISQKILATNLDEIGAANNQIVEVKITSYPRNHKPILGEIVRVLGDKDNMGMEIDIAIANHSLPHQWPDDVIQQTVAIPEQLDEDDYEGREDLRHLPLVTIDGITARDFDDAVFARKTPKGYKLYVAIADVAHYVQKDSPLDVEAVNRATSVYFPNRVIPMLPEKLSNGLCSLNPHVDRLCMVCEMLINDEGEITRSRFYNAVMHSHARLTYETIENVLFKETASLQVEHADLLPHLQTLKSLYEVLRQQRNRRGAIDFQTVEPEFEYDAEGKIAHILARKSLTANQLIEEFMVRANVCAAKFLLKQTGKYCPIALFRNHLGPSEEKYQTLVAALAQEGIKLPKIEGEITSKQLAELVEKIKEKENFESVQMLVLRSMFQAVYEPENTGHFGLALEHYAHFTSPIRRYPDLLVHRAIKHGVTCKGEQYVYSPEQMQALGEQCSMAERRADDAVYDVIATLKCEYMQDKLGQCFEATISGVTSFGFFATLNGEFVDGLVHISSLDGDYFQFDDQRRVLLGERSRKVYQVGDEVEVMIKGVSVEEQRIDFILTDDYLPFGGVRGERAPKKSTKSKKRQKKPSKAQVKAQSKAQAKSPAKSKSQEKPQPQKKAEGTSPKKPPVKSQEKPKAQEKSASPEKKNPPIHGNIFTQAKLEKKGRN